jgi:DNA-binding MarR family transcriptional regulator
MVEAKQPAQLPIGQLLSNLLRIFRLELADRGTGSASSSGIRPAHLQVFGVIKADGTRLTELASAAGLSLSAMSELVDGLEHLGYLGRPADPNDGRAKLVCLTERGWEAIREGRRLIASIERDWAKALGEESFRELRRELQHLLDVLDPSVREHYAVPPGPSQVVP